MKIWTLSFALLLSACAVAPQQKIVQTRSGFPETVIANEKVDVFKSEVTNHMLNNQYSIKEESQNRIVFVKQLTGTQGFLTKASLGNAYSSTPESEISFVFTPASGQTRVVSQGFESTQMAYGQVRKASLQDNVGWFNAVSEMLRKIKLKVES